MTVSSIVFEYFVSDFRFPRQKTNRFLPINFINHPSCGHYIHGPKIQVNIVKYVYSSQLLDFVKRQIRKINDIPTGCLFASLGYRKIFERTTVLDNLYPEMCPSVKMSFIGDNEMQNISSTEFAECHIFASYSPARNFKALIQMSNRIASDLQDVMGNDEEMMKLKEYICTLNKRVDSPKSHKMLLELQKLSAQEVMSSIKEAQNPLNALRAHLDKLDRWFPMDSERLRSLNMTFQELLKLQNIQEDLAPNLQNFESLTQEIVPRLQDSKNILSKLTRKLEKIEEFEAEVKSELEESQHIPEVELILEKTIKFFVDALSNLQETFNLQNDLVLKMIAAKEDHNREAQIEVEWRNVMRSLAIVAHRVHIKFNYNTLLELTKLPLLEMILKVLKLPHSTDCFRRIGYKLASSDSYETKKLHEELYKGLREELSEEEKKHYKELCPTKNTEENTSHSNEEKAFWFGFYHPLSELLDFLSHFRERHILEREKFFKLLIASGVLGSESLSRNESGTNHILYAHETLPDFLANELKKLVNSLKIPHPLGGINSERSISEAIFDSKQILYNAISRARVMCRIYILVDDYTENGAIDYTLKRLFPEARIKHDKA